CGLIGQYSLYADLCCDGAWTGDWKTLSISWNGKYSTRRFQRCGGSCQKRILSTRLISKRLEPTPYIRNMRGQLRRSDCMASITNCSTFDDRSQQGIGEQSGGSVGGKMRGILDVVGLAYVGAGKEQDLASHQRRQCSDLSNVATLKQKILVGEKFIGVV